MAEIKTLKEILIDKGLPEDAAAKFALYVNNAKADEARKKPGKDGKMPSKPVTANTADQLVSLAVKFWNMGILIDGVNAVVSGSNMAMVTYHGYKNKVLQVYPETEFDIQLVREGDEFSVSKESGSIMYQHNLGDPFGTKEQPIIGAYVVFKNKRGEFLETLNKTDYEKMKGASKQSYLWGQWSSEFWLKSVMKRACKRHFFDVVAEIDKNDNDDYGLLAGDAPAATEDQTAKEDAAIASINTANGLDQLRSIFLGLGQLGASPRVFAAKEAKKEELMAMPPTKGPLAEHVKENGEPLEGDEDV